MSVHKFVIYGGGVSAWVTAAALSNSYSAGVAEIVLINPGGKTNEPSIADSGFTSLRRFHANMRISERELMSQTSATFKVGLRYQDWSNSGQVFVHGFGSYGSMLDGIDFHQYATLLHQCGDQTSFDAYSLAAQSAVLGRFGFPGKELVEQGFALDYSLHVDLSSYADLMQSIAIKKQVQVIYGRLSYLGMDGAEKIQSVVLESGEVVVGDFFFDCSGSDSVLISKLAGDRFMPWDTSLPVNKQVSQIAEPLVRSKLCTGLSAHKYGWVKSIPLRDKTLYSLTYNDAFVSDEDAAVAVQNLSGSRAANSAQLSICTPGRRRQFWLGNCLAVGAAAGDFADLALSYLHHVQGGILRFVDLYSTQDVNQFAAIEYNQLTSSEYSRVLDYHQANLLLCSSQSSDFWNSVEGVSFSDELLHKMALFKARGKLAFYEYETWMPAAWISLLLGNGYWPENHDPLLNGCKLEAVVKCMNQMRMTYSNIAAQLPEEKEFLGRYATLNQ